MNDLRSKVQRRVKETPEKSVKDVLKAERSDVKRTTIYIPSESARALKRLAADQDTTMTALINEGVELILKRSTNQPK